MKLKNLITVVLMLMIPLALNAQFYQYVTVDPDGYTNVREKPNANARILGTINKYQVFTTPYNSCYFEGRMHEANNWTPIILSEEPVFKVGYIYKKNVRSMNDLVHLDVIVQDSLNFYFEDEDIRITLSFAPSFELNSISTSHHNENFVIHKEDLQDVYMLNHPILGIEYNGKRHEYLDYNLYKGNNEMYYLYIRGGDGGEAYTVWWIFDRGKLAHRDDVFGSCIAPLPTLLEPPD